MPRVASFGSWLAGWTTRRHGRAQPPLTADHLTAPFFFQRGFEGVIVLQTLLHVRGLFFAQGDLVHAAPRITDGQNRNGMPAPAVELNTVTQFMQKMFQLPGPTVELLSGGSAFARRPSRDNLKLKGPYMTIETINASSTYRRLTPGEVALMVKHLRAHFELKQLALAQDAGVNERTIERIEAGIAVSDETLRKIAKALKLAENVFAESTYCSSDEELMAQVKKIQDDHTVTELHELSTARELENVMGQHGHLIDASAVSDTLADAIASLQDQVRD